MKPKPRLAVFKFASCDGCQLSLLSLEDELLAIAEKVDVVHFQEATSRIEDGPYDVSLVEGSITTAADQERIRQVRTQSRFLMTIGACATSGGIQALKNWSNNDDFLKIVYARPEYIETLATSTAISDHVRVDFELRGCPINKYQLLEVLKAFLAQRIPHTPNHCVCLDCKRKGNVCVMVTTATACLGPVTQAGCSAICPSYDRPCYGCFGPSTQPNLIAISNQFQRDGMSPQRVVQTLRSFNGYAPEFRTESDRIDSQIDASGEVTIDE